MWRQLLGEIWTEVSDGQPVPAELHVTGDPGHLPSNLPVEDMAIACTGAALLAAGQLTGGRFRRISLDRAHIAAAYRSEALLLINGRPAPVGFAPLSAFWRTKDTWLRTHANYPWHREALLTTLGTPDDTDAVAAAIAERDAGELEDAIVAAGGVAAALRTREQWLAEPPGQTVAATPLVTTRRDGDAKPRRKTAEGIKVLDLTRVIAGPVCTRYLAALGADVLRIDPPHLPELPQQAIDSLLGKRSAILDAGAATLHELLDQADVLVHGYRPHALDRFGLTPDALAARHPGLVTVALSAWGAEGPWGNRRGFDSIVQVASGIAVAESPGDGHPGKLPCQLLDHGTGYLCAAAALTSLAAQQAEGGTHFRSLSLSRTAYLLLSAPRPHAPGQTPTAAGPPLITMPGPDGEVSVVPPPGELDGVPLAWPRPLSRYGADPPSWEESHFSSGRSLYRVNTCWRSAPRHPKVSAVVRDNEVIERIDAFCDAVPRPRARAEEHGPLVLFVPTGPGWPYYARPRLGVRSAITTADVRMVRARQRELVIPESFEWIEQAAPDMAAAAADSGLDVRAHPLLVLTRTVPAPSLPPGAEVRIITPEDPDLHRIWAVPSVAFGNPGTDAGEAGGAERDKIAADHDGGTIDMLRDRLRSGQSVLAAAFGQDDGPLAAGSVQAVEEVAEITGVGVLPAHRRQGLGAAVTATLAAAALSGGAATVFLSATDDEVARVYVRTGFREIGVAMIAEPPRQR